ncbi:helix-turn-helix domain-containing protein [Streptomyces sp. NPDC005393]|uniref:sigma-54-dependent Fis family transcriptional regulator n=1 Tax=Streptomyces sp. NPDC005393 TaxID=3157041 RepID=UPI0033AB6CD9
MNPAPAPVSDATVRLARETLMSSGLHTAVELQVPAEIESSWRRSICHAAANQGLPSRRTNAIDPESELLRAARPILDRWQQRLGDMRVAVFLSDKCGHIVDRRISDPTERNRFDSASAAEGFDFSEVAIGTNGLGTVIEARQPLFVRGSEHFNDALANLACAGAPIRHPFTGRPVGSLALASLLKVSHPLMLSMAREAAAQIEQHLTETAGSREIALTMSYFRHRSTRNPMFVLDRDTVLANVAGLSFLSGDVHALLWEALRDAELSPGQQHLDVDFPTFKGPVLARRIDGLGDGSAFLVEVPTESGKKRISEARRPGGDRTATSPAPVSWEAALEGAIEHAAHGTGTVALTGPGGAGKLFAARSWIRRHDPEREPLVVDAALLPDPGTGVRRLGETLDALREGRSVIVRHLESLPGEEVNRIKALDSFVREAVATAGPVHPRPRLVLTLDPEACPPAVADLVSQIAACVEVPALAVTPDRIPELIRSLLESSSGPEHRCMLSSAALQAFLRWNWPGNVAELRRTLTGVARQRPGQVIQHEHLPPHLRTAVQRRRLTRIESMEREAILGALAEAGGNRSRAAELLGMGRTTLYRKLRALGIDVPEQMAP